VTLTGGHKTSESRGKEFARISPVTNIYNSKHSNIRQQEFVQTFSPLLVSDFNQKWKVSTDFRETYQYQNYRKMRTKESMPNIFPLRTSPQQKSFECAVCTRLSSFDAAQVPAANR
jgi:hypothetical protein